MTSLLLRQYPLDPTVPLFLWQPNTVETALHSTHKSKPERFNRLRKYLEQFYPADHQTQLVHSASYSFTQPEVMTIAISDLSVLAEVATSQHILYVPPVQRREIADEELAGQVDSVDHLREMIDIDGSSIR